MRIKAYVGSKIPIYEMANGASETIGHIQPNSFITITDIRKDGSESYYMMEEQPGFVKKHAVKIIRDEEFYYASPLIQKKQNRSRASRYAMIKNTTVAADFGTIFSGRSSSAGIPYTAGNGFGGGIQQQSAQDAWKNDGIVPAYSGRTTGAAANNAAVKGPTPLLTVAGGIGGGLMQKVGGPLGTLGSAAISGFTTGNFNAVNNMNLGGIAGSLFGSTAGSLFNGATINNLTDGTFFNSIFSKNAISIISNILGTLLQKLDYVVGFNLSGALLDLLGGYSKFGLDGFSRSRNTVRNYVPSKLVNVDKNKDERIRKYFKYKGSSNFNLISRGPSGLLGGAEYSPINYNTYSTKTAGKDEEQVRIHRDIYNNLYSDFANDLKKVRESVNLSITRQDWFYNFNRFRLIHPNSVLTNTKGYVFFTRPDLNLLSSTGATSDIGLLINMLSNGHQGILASLQKSASMSGVSFNGHQFIPLLSNRCTGLDINDETLETKEIGDTYTGWKLNYGTNNIKSKAANTVTSSFIDDEQVSIYLIFKLWTEYITAVSRGIISPKTNYVKTQQLDYANSIYYFLCAEDGESILFWTKFTGCIPTNVPSSNFADSLDTPIRQPKYSITWQYAFKKDYDPYTLAEFNRLSGNGDFDAMPMYDKETIRSGRTIVGSPYIDTNNGGYIYKMRFRKPANTFTSGY